MEKYIICSAMTDEQLQVKVNKLMQKGYEPHGSLSFIMTDEYQRFYQPMVLKVQS